MSQMESVRLSINEHMTSVGEEIVCVLEKQHGVDVCNVKLNVRVFVLERLSAAAKFICNLFQREIETLETLLETQNKLPLDINPIPADILHLPVSKEDVSSERRRGKERSPSRVQEEPEPPHIKEEQEELLQRPEEFDRPILTLPAVKCEDGENRDTEPVASTSSEHVKTQAYIKYWVQSQPTSDNQLLSSHRPEDSDEKETHSMKSHTGKKGYSCTVCGKTCTLKGNLKKHMMTHTDGKPFICSVCGKGFNQKAALNVHMRTHTGEKPFVCAFCSKGFAHTGDLKKHMMTHTGEKPFTCTVCGKGFSQKVSLKAHMRTHTGGNSFSYSSHDPSHNTA